MALRTVALLLRLRPRAIVVVAPPFVAPLVAVPLARLLGARVAVDVHSGALLGRAWRPLLPVLYAVCRWAGTALVTLPSLAERLRSHRVDPLVMPDPLPDLAVSGRSMGASPDGLPHVVAVCGWGDDEPLEELVEAARGRPFHLSLTGRPRRRFDLPPNVTLAGFVDEAAYARLLSRADAIVCLTRRDETLLCASWEALSVARPLVLSDTAAQRATFGPGVTYVAPDPASIGAGIETVLARQRDAERSSAELATRFEAEGERNLAALRARLDPA
jgi:hypothetical protein